MDKSYCIFGDSVTEAAYVKSGWVVLLREYLEDKYKDGFVSVFNLGVGGNTSDDVLKRFKSEALARGANSILFAAGINDTKSNDPIMFKSNTEKLIKEAKEITSDITFVGLVLGDYKDKEPFSEKKTTDYNKIIEELAESEDCRFVSLQEKLKPEDFMDGLHPNKEGHRKIFEEIKKYF